MRLDDLEVFVVEPPEGCWGGRYWTFVKVVTSNGIAGIGEVYASSVGPDAMTHVINDVFDRHMRGENPENVELMFRRAYSSGFSQRPDPTVIGAFSGLEIACWDIIGKARERPVHALLGGLTNRRIRSYSYLYPEPGEDADAFFQDPIRSAECAARMVGQGFTAVKFDPAGPYTIRGGRQPTLGDIERSAEFCRLIREAVGSRADILFGTHGQFTASGAIRLARRIEEYDPLWFEEPVPPDNVEDMAQVARSVRIPVATGERLTTKAEFASVLRHSAASILQPALGRAGGILEAKKIAGMAEAHNAQMAPHLYAGPVEWAANIQLAATVPNLLIVESIQIGSGFHAELVGGTIGWEDGYIVPPSGPGLGIEFNEALARSRPYSGGRLHLEMQEADCVPGAGGSVAARPPAGKST